MENVSFAVHSCICFYNIFDETDLRPGQLQKMGILKTKAVEETPSKRKSTDFSKLPPLKPGGAVGFMNYREGEGTASAKAGKKSKKSSESDMDSEDEDEEEIVAEKVEEDDTNDTTHLSPDDLRRQKDLAEGVRKIKVSQVPSVKLRDICCTSVVLKPRQNAYFCS